MKVASQMPSSTCLDADRLAGEDGGELIFWRCRQTRPQAVTGIVAVVERVGQLGQAT